MIGPGPSRPEDDRTLDEALAVFLRAKRAAGEEVIVVTSNPASAASDPLLAWRTYLEPLDLEAVRAIVLAERPSSVITVYGGQKAQELANALASEGTLEEVGAELGSNESFGSGERQSPPADAIAVSVDALTDGKRVVIASVTEHLEPPFVHVGDAAAITPPFTLGPEIVVRIEERVRSLATELGVVGLFAVRLAVSGDTITVSGVERGAGVTTPFVTRATGLPLLAIAADILRGKTLDDLGVTERALPRHVAAREVVFPPPGPEGDAVLGPQQRSTGEVIGLDDTPARAYAKALRGIGFSVSHLSAPREGRAAPRSVLFSVTESERLVAVELARRFRALGFDLLSVGGTAEAIAKARIPVDTIAGTDAPQRVRNGDVALAIVTARRESELAETRPIRSACLGVRIPCFTTMRLARLGCAALEEAPAPRIRPLQEWYADD